MALIRDPERFDEWLGVWKRHACHLLNTKQASKMELDVVAQKVAMTMQNEGTVENADLAVGVIREKSQLIVINWNDKKEWFADRKSWAEETRILSNELVSAGLIDKKIGEAAVKAILDLSAEGKLTINGCQITTSSVKFYDWYAQLSEKNEKRTDTLLAFMKQDIEPETLDSGIAPH